MNAAISKKTINWWDWSGIFFSSLCLLHCTATPVLLASASLWLLSEWVHMMFVLPLVPITLVASRRAFRTDQKRWPAILLLAGIVLLIGALLMEGAIGETAEISMTILGSVLMIAGHLGNRHMYVCREES